VDTVDWDSRGDSSATKPFSVAHPISALEDRFSRAEEHGELESLVCNDGANRWRRRKGMCLFVWAEALKCGDGSVAVSLHA
jgi:predicted lipoprotein with Yx(FWY)xxD motif